MNQRQRFIRKIVYACVIAVLLLPLSWLSQPETTESKGGRLAQLRSDYQLGQAQLGEIDPASETIKLATLGMRGVAANLLWHKADEYRKTEDWVNLSATLEQISKLQPNFVSVWIFQGWNLSYNISVEFDDYHDRYYWVIKGIDFLKEGTQYNHNEPRLISKIGWTISNKIGRADEHVQFRRLFLEDDDFNGPIPRSQRDNWLVGREWMLKAEDVVAGGAPLRGESPLLFYSHPVMCLVNYAEALEEEGRFGEVAKNAWRKAGESWSEFSKRDLPTQYNMFVRLSDKEVYDEKSKQAQEKLDRSAPGVREKILAEKVAALTQEERAFYETPPEKRTSAQYGLLYTVETKTQIDHMEVADRVEGENRAAALAAAEEATFADAMSSAIDIERGIVNYDYWMLRCEVEPDDDTLEARKLIYDADQAFSSAQLLTASEKYAAGFKKWREVLDAHPPLLKDANLTDELAASIEHYRNVVHQLDEKFPEPFILQDVLDAYWRTSSDTRVAGEASKDKADSDAADPSKPSP
ncbi:MAG: hypothetical protein WD063_11975 [Pirellulales bacterium]